MSKRGFMTVPLPGSKADIKKANKVGNIIAASVIIAFLIALVTVVTSHTASAQSKDLGPDLINMMDEIEKPFQTVLDNLKIDSDVNTIEHGVNRQGRMFIKATYYDTGNTVTHIFSKKNSCESVEFRSTNFRNYDLFMKAVSDTMVQTTFDKVKSNSNDFFFDMKVQEGLWFIRVTRRS